MVRTPFSQTFRATGRTALLVLCCFFAQDNTECACRAASVAFPKSPAGWSVVAAPLSGSDNLNRASLSLCRWRLSLRDGRALVALDRNNSGYDSSILPFKIGRSKSFFGQQISTKVDDGWLVGFNAGEFGGTLWWFSPDGHSHYEVSQDQVAAFLHAPTGLVALQGLAHLGLAYGSVRRLTRTAQGRWKSTLLTPLGDAPEAAALDADGWIVVAGASKLMRVSPLGQVQVLVHNAVWGMLYPDSMVRVGKGEFYVGMRAYLVHVTMTPAGAKTEWLLPNRTFLKTGPRESL